MKDRSTVIKLFQLLSIVLLYYIAGKNSMFLYAITLSLYNIYSSCFKHITLKETFKKTNNDYSKFKILKYTTLSIIVVTLIFTLFSILMSDTINILLNIDNTFLPYLIMSISIISKPIVKMFLEYLESYNKPKLSNRLLYIYDIIEVILFVTIIILSISIFRIPTHISISLFYLSKILSSILIITIIYLVLRKSNIKLDKKEEDTEINYKIELKDILKNNSHKSLITVIKNSYYYISIIVLYMVLSTKYRYSIDLIEKEITFIYLYALTIVNFVGNIVTSLIKKEDKKINIISYILSVFRCILTISIIIGITSPLICKIIFNDNSNSIYLMILSFLSIFIVLYNITFENIKNKKIIYTSLIIGIFSKIILVIPLINSFYRMGYNLIYGDIISTIIGMFISIIINYIYLKNKNSKEKTMEKIFTTLYESIILCIMLVVLQFIIPIKTNNYFYAIMIFIVYIAISMIFLKFKRRKRG